MTDGPSAESRRQPSRRHILLGLAALPFGLSACFAEPAGKTVGTGDAGVFPVKISHLYGSTTVKKAPKRIATLGSSSADVCMALGVVPAGISDSNVTPWFNLVLADLAAPMPILYPENEELPIRQLEDLEPDLILAVNSRLTKTEFEELSRIAPVVASPGRAFDTEWRTSVTMVATALGRAKDGKDLIRDTEKDMADSTQDYPKLTGASFLFAGVDPALGADFALYAEASNPVRILADFGLAPAPLLASAEARERVVDREYGPLTIQWARDQGDLLSADIFIAAIERNVRDEIEEQDVLTEVPARERNAVVFSTADEYTAALETGSPLGIRWIARNLIPELARAAYNSSAGR